MFFPKHVWLPRNLKYQRFKITYQCPWVLSPPFKKTLYKFMIFPFLLLFQFQILSLFCFLMVHVCVCIFLFLLPLFQLSIPHSFLNLNLWLSLSLSLPLCCLINDGGVGLIGDGGVALIGFFWVFVWLGFSSFICDGYVGLIELF